MFLISYLQYWFEESNANPFDYARITDVDYKAVVVDEPNNSGNIIVTERLTFDIHAASKDNLFWELWRALPENYIDGLKVHYKVNSVKQILEDGSEIIYEESPKLYWDDSDYVVSNTTLGPGKWYHSEGPYNEAYRNYECVLFYVDGLYREQVTFEIEYEMINAAFRYNDCSELYLSFYSEDTIKYLKSFNGQILIPNKDMPNYENYDAHTYGTNSMDFDFTESDTINPGYHTFLFELDESSLKFSPHNQYIEFTLISHGKDKHIFTEYAPANYYSNDNVLQELRDEHEEYVNTYKEFRSTKVTILLICSACAYLIIDNSLKIDKKMKKKHLFYEPTIKFDYFRDIPSNLDPNFAANLVFCKGKLSKKANNDGYAAIMLSLVRKGYIELDRMRDTLSWSSHNVKIVVKHKPIQLQSSLYQIQDSLNMNTTLEPLTPSEEHYFNLIVRHSHGTEISMSSFQSKISSDYIHTDGFVRNVEKSVVNIGISEGYFQKADYEQPKREIQAKAKSYKILGILLVTIVNLISYQTRVDLAFGAFFILGIAFIISSIYLKKVAGKYVLLTQFGEDEYSKWHGLYNFLNSETLMSERTVVELPLWEKYLIYATAFGISDKVIKAINIRCPESTDMSPILNNSYYRSKSFYSTSRSFRTATRSASYTAHSGSYGGGSRRLRWRWSRRWWRPEVVINN